MTGRFVSVRMTLNRGGFKAENLLGHITRKGSSPLPCPPFPPLPSLPLPLEVGPLIAARGSGGAL